MPTKRDEDAEARREAEKRAPIKIRGLEIPDLPKNVIANEIKRRIQVGIFRPGEQVPSITDIMEMSGAAKNTSRAALDILRENGYIKTLTGFGSFVNPQDQWK
jgi:DNA-binding GntR family transcriptional regulator